MKKPPLRTLGLAFLCAATPYKALAAPPPDIQAAISKLTECVRHVAFTVQMVGGDGYKDPADRYAIRAAQSICIRDEDVALLYTRLEKNNEYSSLNETRQFLKDIIADLYPKLAITFISANPYR